MVTRVDDGFLDGKYIMYMQGRGACAACIVYRFSPVALRRLFASLALAFDRKFINES